MKCYSVWVKVSELQWVNLNNPACLQGLVNSSGNGGLTIFSSENYHGLLFVSWSQVNQNSAVKWLSGMLIVLFLEHLWELCSYCVWNSLSPFLRCLVWALYWTAHKNYRAFQGVVLGSCTNWTLVVFYCIHFIDCFLISYILFQECQDCQFKLALRSKTSFKLLHRNIRSFGYCRGCRALPQHSGKPCLGCMDCAWSGDENHALKWNPSGRITSSSRQLSEDRQSIPTTSRVPPHFAFRWIASVKVTPKGSTLDTSGGRRDYAESYLQTIRWFLGENVHGTGTVSLFWGRWNLGMCFCFCTRGAENKGVSLGSRKQLFSQKVWNLFLKQENILRFFFPTL